ncbi:T-cell surface protein tactile isoform X2 [Melanerpes formicivorus]|uniref:T-cell surface protein tactile isoform X2 n=1 Tax=Melanerpes formicivorus TaxID=211600 RepID=UPI0035902151
MLPNTAGTAGEKAKRVESLPKLQPVRMEKRRLLSFLSLLLLHRAAGHPEDIITKPEVVHALPGTDVTLACRFLKPHSTYIIQTQWSKTDGTQLTRIAVYHPDYGTHYFTFPEASYNFSVSFSTRKCCGQDAAEALCPPDANTTAECSQWALNLTNVTTSLSGHYECSFSTYPHGNRAAGIQLIIKAEDNKPNEASSEAFTTVASEGVLTSAPETKRGISSTALRESLTTAYLKSFSTESLQSLKNATRSPENSTPLPRDLSFSITEQPVSVTREKDFFTTSSLLNSTGGLWNMEGSHFPWPAVVAILLLLCSFLIVLGIRKWCQYQKEIMNRPPPFKPPPPPIKYASMVESDGTAPSCHELENL